MRPKPKIWDMLTQWAQDNKFVESGLKNWVLMNWTTANMSLKDNSNKTTDTNMNRFPVRGDSRSYKSVETEYKYRLDCYSVPSRVFTVPLVRGRSLTLCNSSWIILILHLLIIYAITWVLVPSDTFFSFLWVAIAKTVLFRGLLHINAIRKVAAMHLMWW